MSDKALKVQFHVIFANLDMRLLVICKAANVSSFSVEFSVFDAVNLGITLMIYSDRQSAFHALSNIAQESDELGISFVWTPIDIAEFHQSQWYRLQRSRMILKLSRYAPIDIAEFHQSQWYRLQKSRMILKRSAAWRDFYDTKPQTVTKIRKRVFSDNQEFELLAFSQFQDLYLVTLPVNVVMRNPLLVANILKSLPNHAFGCYALTEMKSAWKENRRYALINKTWWHEVKKRMFEVISCTVSFTRNEALLFGRYIRHLTVVDLNLKSEQLKAIEMMPNLQKLTVGTEISTFNRGFAPQSAFKFSSRMLNSFTLNAKLGPTPYISTDFAIMDLLKASVSHLPLRLKHLSLTVNDTNVVMEFLKQCTNLDSLALKTESLGDFLVEYSHPLKIIRIEFVSKQNRDVALLKILAYLSRFGKVVKRLELVFADGLTAEELGFFVSIDADSVTYVEELSLCVNELPEFSTSFSLFMNFTSLRSLEIEVLSRSENDSILLGLKKAWQVKRGFISLEKLDLTRTALTEENSRGLRLPKQVEIILKK